MPRLNSLDRRGSAGARRILTPHVGELTRRMAAAGDRFESIPDDLTSDDQVRVATASSAAVTWGQVVVRKGAPTVIAGGEPDPGRGERDVVDHGPRDRRAQLPRVGIRGHPV
jgi:NAD(P)H-hydrate repair Nnr-like enzyme with NAD(P)H-hydrate dehydratase domain